jgi:small nuclear ribonucleoprotein (snRNP)-like protein
MLISFKKKKCFDLLSKFIDKKIQVYTKNSKKLNGYLYGFDFHLNILIAIKKIIKLKKNMFVKNKNLVFIRGDNILLISFINK